MLLAVDIGNSSTTVGGFASGDAPVFTVRFASEEHRTADEYAAALREALFQKGISLEEITDAAIASVVPPLSPVWETALQQLCPGRVLTVGAGVRTGIAIRTDSPSEVGADIIANAAAVAQGEGPAILLDIGTATTIFALNGQKELIGGVILPGIRSSMESLRSATAQLPIVALERPKKPMGKNTVECISTGVLLGHAFSIDGFIERFSVQPGMEGAKVIATGGLLDLLLPLCQAPMEPEPYLTLKGLRVIYEKTRKNKVC